MDAGFVGLGSMGQPMARNLLQAGHRVTVWNRRRSRAEALEGTGAIVAATPADAARAGVVLTMLADDAALEAVTTGANGIQEGLPEGGTHVSMSTVGAETVERLARAHAQAGQTLISAPVFGRPDMAAVAKLFIVAAGREDAVSRVRPLLDAMGQRVFPLGPEPAHANLVKLAGNFLITAAIEAFAEAAAVLGKAGVDQPRFLQVMLDTLFGAPVYRNYGPIVLEERYSPPGFTLPLGLKDNRLLLQTGERLAVPLPLASLVRDRMLAALARGYGDLDWSAFARITAEEAGTAGASVSAHDG
jgi:3-hydroxyisobutyrate dehydrogenase-like beta-hydroxyacid dehydrogenase